MTSDFDSEIAAELEAALTLRPGLDLYGVHGRPVAPFGSAGSKSFVDPAPFHWCLPDELLFKIFAKMTPYDLGKAACVCRNWENAVRDPVFWRNACLKDWQIFGEVENYKILQSEYDGSWKKMWLLRSRVRTDGFYVIRHTYISAQFTGRNVRNRVVKYSFRYLRFYPSGGLLYKTTSKEVKDLAKLMNFRASKAECVCNGHYMLSDDRVEATFFPRGLQHPVWRICLRLGGTKVGANDRMDLLSLVVSSVNDGEAPSTDEDPLFAVPDGTAICGLTHFIFVPFEELKLILQNWIISSSGNSSWDQLKVFQSPKAWELGYNEVVKCADWGCCLLLGYDCDTMDDEGKTFPTQITFCTIKSSA